MTISLPQRVPRNAPGDFYVEAGLCTRCCLVHGEAPELMGNPDDPYEECYFKRQPANPQEVDRAISAMCVSEMCALRYAGDDEAIIKKLRAQKMSYLCDQTPEGLAWIKRSRQARQAKLEPQTHRDRWWLKLFGWMS